MNSGTSVLARDVAAGSSPGAQRRDVLDNLRVLFLPKNSRVDYFMELLRRARKDHGWSVFVPCPPDAQKLWAPVVGESGPIAIPDFLQPTNVDSDAAARDDIDAFIAACEKASGISAGRIVLAGERDLGRGFARPIYHWFHNAIAKATLADNLAAFPILRRMFAFARDTLLKTRPDLVMAGEWADPLCFTFQLAARQMGMPCLVNRPSKLWSGRSYWSAEISMYNAAARQLADELRRAEAPVSERSQTRIRDFRATPDTLGYVKQNWADDDQRNWLAYHNNLARMFGVQVRHRLRGGGGPAPKPALQIAVGHYREPLLARKQAKFFRRFDEAALRDMRYVFVAFHKDPEQALNYQAWFWTNQLNTAALISGALPAGYHLLIREHRRNTGRRPTDYYRQLRRMPGVTLIDAFDDQFKYIANADLVVTENGSTGWEGLMLGRRVLTLDNTFYDGARLAQRVRDPENLAAIMIDALAKPAVSDPAAHDRALGWMLDAEWATSAPANPADYDAILNGLRAALEQRAQARTDIGSINA
jgi:hypothetical protein